MDERAPAVSAAVGAACMWDRDMVFAEQLKLMQALQRIAEHFVAAAMSMRANREMDAIAIVVMGCICALADALMRKRALDEPSEACSHLMGQCRDGRQLGMTGFGIGVDSFAAQSAAGVLHHPELCVARTEVLNCFRSPAQEMLHKIFRGSTKWRCA